MPETITEKGLDKFIKKMRQKLILRYEKYGNSWVDCDIIFLENKLFEEINEYLNEQRYDRKSEELIDIANVCMMLHHRHLFKEQKRLINGT